MLRTSLKPGDAPLNPTWSGQRGLFAQGVTSALVVLICAYKFAIRPFLVGSCKFWPTCSDYGIEALRTHGPWRGLWLTGRRVCRCHPLSTGGCDPVPPSSDTPNPEPAPR